MFVEEVVEIVNPRGESVIFDGSPYGIVSLEGLGDVEAVVHQQKSPHQDGTTFVDTTLEPRYIPIEFIIRGSNYLEVSNHRKYLSKVLNPKLGLSTLKYYYENIVREIPVVAESVPVYADLESRGERWQRGLVSFVAPNPYWRSLHSTSRALQAYVGNFTLPFTLPFELGVEGDSTTLINDGDMPAPVIIDIHGPTVNPRVINRTTGEFIKVNRSIEANEILHIDTTPGQKKVHLYRGNRVIPIFGDLDHDSDFFFLEVGENEIEHVADAGNASALVAITWQNMYVGV